MLRTRLWMGAILIVLVIGVLVVDWLLDPWYPFLLLTMLAVVVACCLELIGLLGPARRLPAWFCCAAVGALLVANWPAFILAAPWHKTDPWHWVLGTFVVVILSAFVVEMATFREPGESVTRVAVTILIVAYLGLLPCFLVQLRWSPVSAGDQASRVYRGTVALLLAVFVPKCGDIGAYLTGRFLGRTKMTPLLSPKKTWEGFAGGLAAAVLTAIVLYQFEPALRVAPTDDFGFGAVVLKYLGDLAAIRGMALAPVGFGATVWLAGVLGDLAESLIKRDCRRKDASQNVPGFGGLLDVVDSVVFAAPVAYCWLRLGAFP
jgi:phosphatidate cytidylyltransferase